MRSIQLILSYCCWTTVVQASILTGFATKEVPSLEDIPNIAEQVRKFSRSHDYGFEQAIVKGRRLKTKKEYSQEESEPAYGETEQPQEQTRQADDNRFPFVPEAPPEFNSAGELSFVILMDEFGYNTDDIAIGTKFAFSGRLSTDAFQVGQSSGTCTIGSDIDTNFACCTFYLTFNSDGFHGFGTVALSGNTDQVGGYLQVTGTGGDLSSTSQGTANLVFDPAGNPIIYILIRLN